MVKSKECPFCVHDPWCQFCHPRLNAAYNIWYILRNREMFGRIPQQVWGLAREAVTGNDHNTTYSPGPVSCLEAEENVLGAMMLSPSMMAEVSEVLDASDFQRETHATIYAAALSLYARGEPVDAITLADELEERGKLEDVGGRERIHELVAHVPIDVEATNLAIYIKERGGDDGAR